MLETKKFSTCGQKVRIDKAFMCSKVSGLEVWDSVLGQVSFVSGRAIWFMQQECRVILKLTSTVNIFG